MFRPVLDVAASEHCWVFRTSDCFLGGGVLDWDKEGAVMISAAPRGFLPLLAGVSASQQQLLST